MNANELIVRAQALGRALGRSFPTELRAYASGWQRQGYDLPWCWYTVQSALRQGRALCNVEAEVHRHHARLQAEKDARDLKAGETLVTAPAPSREPWCYPQSSPEDAPSPASVDGPPDDPDGLRPCVERPQMHPTARRKPYRKRAGTKADRVRELLKAHVVRKGFIEVRKIERFAKGDGLLEEDQEIGRCSTFRRVMEELNIESHRIGYGPYAHYVWRVKPPAWTRGFGCP
jgi:hypothetical protein